jgi:hypothetical protein
MQHEMFCHGAPEMALRGFSSQLSWPLWGLFVTLLVGMLLGGHERQAFAQFPLVFSYAYWVIRLLMGYLLFAGALVLLELSPLPPRRAVGLSWVWPALAAALITLPFFTLGVSMLDLLLGLPELGPHGFGLDSSGQAEPIGAMVSLFAVETLLHLDNHLALCALILVPRLLQCLAPDGAQAQPGVPEQREESRAATPAMAATAPARSIRPALPTPAFLERFDPPLKGQVFAVQAQEHYVRVITAEGAPTTLYRFGDALRELEGLAGMQVHRSFWVADAGVVALKNGRRGMRIVLRNGEQVPVSARHAEPVQRRFGERLETVA